MADLTELDLDLLEQAQPPDGLRQQDTRALDHYQQLRVLERAALVRRTAEKWFTTDDGGRELVAAGRKTVHLAIQRWGRSAKGAPS